MQSKCEYWVHFEESVTSELCQIVLSFVERATREYIWHRQPFALAVDPSHKSALRGTTDCTDCVDDEWLIVWLLKRITEEWQGAVAAIQDEDGQFLLIEGAEHLPRWVTPANADNRVWLSGGHLHLVPLNYKSDVPFVASDDIDADQDEEAYIDREYAVSLVRDAAMSTRADADLERVVFERITGYPAKMREHMHRTLVYVPRDIATALANEPRLVAEAVAAFYERDPSSLKALTAMSRFPPTTASLATVMMTRPLYSQLLLQRFFAPKPFLAANWFDNTASGERGETDKRRREIGMKLTCGFEMLYATSAQSRETIDPSSPAYKAFLVRLTESGYFEGEIEGSARWTFKERQARSQFIQQRADRDPLFKPFSRRVDEACSIPPATSPFMSIPEGELPPTAEEAKAKGLEDDDAWLNIDAQGLEDILQSRATRGVDEEFDDISDVSTETDHNDDAAAETSDRQKRSEEDRIARRAARMLKGMACGVEQFVEGKGGLEGAEFDDERSSGDDTDDDDDGDRMDAAPEISPQERKKRMDALVAGLQEEEWGSKTAAEASMKARTDKARTAEASAPKLGRDKYDGASDDSSTDEDEDADAEGEEPAVELDLEEEMDDFLKFATETLGLSEDQYAAILREREQRGAFVPSQEKREKRVNVLPDADPATAAAAAEPNKPKLANPNLKDFDSLMAQMDVELANAKATQAPVPNAKKTARATTTTKKKKPAAGEQGKVVVSSDSDSGDEDGDVAMMDEELAELFSRSGEPGSGAGDVDYNLVKNFLESFQSQGGFAGPAETLSGRLGFKLPRDAPK